MKNRFQFLLLLLGALAPGLLRGQTTGSFDSAIVFMGGTRQLALHVPPGYAPANKYKLMICLHGLGDSCVNYRNGLINGLGWATNMPNTIFVCPEAETKNADFYSFAGSEAIISESIAVAMAKYHIDTANVVLQGFSLGGRAALQYGLDHTNTFKGLLLNTPAVQGIKDALNGHAPFHAFAYGNASQIPIYITHGANDFAYTSAIDTTYEQLVRNNGVVRYFDFPGLGHAIPPFAQISSFNSFFSIPATVKRDVEAVLFYPVPLLSCNTPAGAALLFRNTGQDTLHTVKFKYTLGNTTQSGTWTGTLLPFQHATFEASFSNPAAGTNNVTIKVDSLEGSYADTVLGNNQQSAILNYSASALPSLNEGFEGATFPPAGWAVEAGGDFYTNWDLDNTIAKTGNQSVTAFNTILFFDNAGRQEGLITPRITVPLTNPQLSFDVAFNYHRYTPPYLVPATNFADTLEVLVSTDCGAHYTSLYKKGGADLATFSAPILNALSIPASFMNPADTNWRREHINLSPLLTGNNGTTAHFKFSFRSALGGHIALDNVQIAAVSGVAKLPQTKYRVYPNPVSDLLTIEGVQGGTGTITNALGQVLLKQKMSNSQEQMQITNLPVGLYLLTLTGEDGAPTTIRIMKQ